MLPGVGDVVDVLSVANAVNKRDYKSAAKTAGLSFLPSNANKLKQEFTGVVNKVLDRSLPKGKTLLDLQNPSGTINYLNLFK